MHLDCIDPRSLIADSRRNGTAQMDLGKCHPYSSDGPEAEGVLLHGEYVFGDSQRLEVVRLEASYGSDGIRRPVDFYG